MGTLFSMKIQQEWDKADDGDSVNFADSDAMARGTLVFIDGSDIIQLATQMTVWPWARARGECRERTYRRLG